MTKKDDGNRVCGVCGAYVRGGMTHWWCRRIMTAIVCCETLQYAERPDDVLREFRRVLRPHGRLVLSVPGVKPDDPEARWWWGPWLWPLEATMIDARFQIQRSRALFPSGLLIDAVAA